MPSTAQFVVSSCFSGIEYLYRDQVINFEDTFNECRKEEAKLVEITTEPENDQVFQFSKQNSNETIYIGLKRGVFGEPDDPTSYQFVTSEEFINGSFASVASVSPWDNDQPTNNIDSLCVRMLINEQEKGLWENIKCGRTNNFVCQRSCFQNLTQFPSQLPTKAPTVLPTKSPTRSPTKFPSETPTLVLVLVELTALPTQTPTKFPTQSPTIFRASLEEESFLFEEFKTLIFIILATFTLVLVLLTIFKLTKKTHQLKRLQKFF